jgi:hypothetical protein
MISVIISIILAVLLAVAIFVITHQKKVHEEVLQAQVTFHLEALGAKNEVIASRDKAVDFWYKAHESANRDFKALRAKIEADAAKLAAEPEKIVAAVKSKARGKKA